MMTTFTTAAELRFLAAQCAKQAASPDRADDAAFLIRLGGCLAILGDDEARRRVGVSITMAREADDAECADLIRLCGTIINDRAARLERGATTTHGDAA